MSQMMTSKMSNGLNDCQSEVRDVFEKLRSLREESHRQFSDIIDSHSSSIGKGINDLVEEVRDLRAELSVTRKEKNILLETVDNLNGEIRQLNEKLPNIDSTSEPEEKLNQSIREENESEVDISVDIGKALESTCNDADDVEAISDERVDTEELIEDRVMEKKDSNTSFYNSPQGNGKSCPNKEGNYKTIHSEDVICPECNFEFSTNENLRIHLKNVHSQLEQRKVTRQDLSKEKNTQAGRETDLNLDARLSVDPKLQNESSIEGEEKTHKTTLVEKMKQHKHSMHDMIKNFKCDLCPYETARGTSLRYHNYSIHKIGDAKFKCELCPYTSVARGVLKKHIKRVHAGIKIHVCEDCGFATSTKTQLNSHRDSVHKMGDKKYSCELCPFKSNEKTNLRTHIKGVHDKIRDHVCEDCGFATVTKGHLNRHRDSVHKMGEKKHSCELCTFKTYEKRTLKSHIKRIHEKIRDHVCGECGYASSHKNDLKMHKEFRHGTRDKKFKCDCCPFETHIKEYLRRHVKNAHSKKL